VDDIGDDDLLDEQFMHNNNRTPNDLERNGDYSGLSMPSAQIMYTNKP